MTSPLHAVITAHCPEPTQVCVCVCLCPCDLAHLEIIKQTNLCTLLEILLDIMGIQLSCLYTAYIYKTNGKNVIKKINNAVSKFYTFYNTPLPEKNKRKNKKEILATRESSNSSSFFL